jgi:hypothetical protein
MKGTLDIQSAVAGGRAGGGRETSKTTTDETTFSTSTNREKLVFLGGDQALGKKKYVLKL